MLGPTGAVRHRNGNPGPNAGNNNPSMALEVRTDGGNGGKVHRGSRRRPNKQLLVVAGTLSVLALCLAGMWGSSGVADSRRGGAGGRQRKEGKKNRLDDPRRPRVKSPDRPPRPQRPHGLGLREKEELFVVPEEKRSPARPIKLSGGSGDAREERVRRNVGPPPKNYPRKAEVSDVNKRHTNHEEEVSGEDKDEEVSGNEMEDNGSGDENDEVAAGNFQHAQPRVLRLHFEEVPTNEKRSNDEDKNTMEDGPQFNFQNVRIVGVQRLSTWESEDLASSERVVSPYPDDDEYQGRLDEVKLSKKYRAAEREPLVDEECKPRHDWQSGAFPNCNALHELELGQLSGMFGKALREKLRKQEGDGDEIAKYLAHGYWRDVWAVSRAASPWDPSAENGEELLVVKTLRYKHGFTDRNYDRHRKDALASERLSGSDAVVDIFAFCSNTGIYEFGSGGDIEGKLWPYDKEEDQYIVADIPSIEKLDMAIQVATAIADMHDVEEDGYASIAHTDITPSQFILINNKWKLNDFNRCRFMRVYKEDNSPCGFHVGANPGKFRAPEEYAYEEETEKIDIYSMGNVFYAMIAGEMPFEGQKEKKAQAKVMDGIRPKIPSEVLESEDPAITALVSATKRCWTHEPVERPKAALIRDQLKEAMDRIKNGANKRRSIV